MSRVMMRMDDEPISETKIKNESFDSEGSYDITGSSSPRRLLCSSVSSLEGEQKEANDSDNDSGFTGVSQGSSDRLDTITADVTNETNECPKSCLQRAHQKYDRENVFLDFTNRSISVETRRFRKIEQLTESYADAANIFLDEEPDTCTSGKKGQESIMEMLRNELKSIPASLMHFLKGMDRPGNYSQPPDQKPDWLDMDKFRKGQKFAQDHMFPIYFAELLSLFALFSFEDGLKPLIISGRSNTPYTAFKRYLSTGLRVRHWYTEDLWEKETLAHKDILTVRAMHAAARRRLEASTNEEIDAAAKIPDAFCPTQKILLDDFSETCKPPVISQCPYILLQKRPDRPKGINQADMAFTQWGFIGFIASYPKYLGIHDATDEGLEAFCHLWRSIGYQLGIEDEFNFCRGTLEEIRQRSHDFVEIWVKPNLRGVNPEWEHMMRCVISGVAAFLPGVTYETALLYLSEMLDLKLPRFWAAVSYKDWLNHNLLKSLFSFTIRLPGVAALLNGLLNRSLNRAESFTPDQFEAIRTKLTL